MTHALLAMSHSPLLHHADLDAEVNAEVEASFDAARGLRPRLRPGPDHQLRARPLQRLLLQPDAAVLHRLRGDQHRRLRQSGRPPGRPLRPRPALAESVIGTGIDRRSRWRWRSTTAPSSPSRSSTATSPPSRSSRSSSTPSRRRSPRCPHPRPRRGHRHLATLDKKVLFISSGGLSHDPPVPRLAEATPAQRDMLTGGGRHPTPEARAARQQRVIDTAHASSRGSRHHGHRPGMGPRTMEILASGDLTPLDAWDPD